MLLWVRYSHQTAAGLPETSWKAWVGSLESSSFGDDGPVDLYSAYVAPHGGRYLLAVQNSNDAQLYIDNPQGTAYRLCVIWREPDPQERSLALPLVLKLAENAPAP